MFAFYDNLTPAQKLLVTALLSMLFASLAAAGAAVGQLYVQGQVNIVVLFTTFMTVFFLGMSRELAAYVPAHVQVELQGLRDSESQARDALARQQAITQSAINKNVTAVSQAQGGPLVAINTPQLTMTTIEPPKVSVFNPAPPPDVSRMDTQAVPVPQVAFPPLPSVDEASTALTTMAQAFPAVDYSMLHFGDTQDVPTVAP